MRSWSIDGLRDIGKTAKIHLVTNKADLVTNKADLVTKPVDLVTKGRDLVTAWSQTLYLTIFYIGLYRKYLLEIPSFKTIS